ncbi:MAG TPA: hypothetical protein VL137_10555 [Polyangiaceae bacterium]|jgi:hypothetical protein|nr:hypothetical protein [Polyangiaceae bacterium]
MRNTIVLVLGCSLVWACEDPKPVAVEQNPPAAAAVAPAAVKANPEPAKPAASATTAADEAQKAVEENPLTPCCRALGRKGFVEHSPEYTGAGKQCGEAMTDKKTIEQIRAELKTTLKGKALPDECAAK